MRARPARRLRSPSRASGERLISSAAFPSAVVRRSRLGPSGRGRPRPVVRVVLGHRPRALGGS
ncbi:Hypothetical protein A7982_11744 [Minicystis rosea]|nr:Hypothetical protein A7982_11744 [Minicystis rosea]